MRTLNYTDLQRKIRDLPAGKYGYLKFSDLFMQTYPEQKFDPESIQHCLNAFNALAEQNTLIAPSPNGDGWHYHGALLKPVWFRLKAAPKVKATYEAVMWHPLLREVHNLKNPAQIGIAVQINQFLIQNPTIRRAPLNERSFQIFNDEKRLSTLIKDKRTLLNGILTLDDLNTYIIYPPLPYKRFSVQNNKGLVVENVTTYDTICRWNQIALAYQFVIYGSGAMFEGSHWGLNDFISPELKQIYYCGDLDLSGLRIPCKTNQLRIENQLCPLYPANEIYELMLSQEKCNLSLETYSEACDFHQWLAPYIQESTRDLLIERKRIPQETITFELLQTLKI